MSSTSIPTSRPVGRSRSALAAYAPDWSAEAWWAICATGLFLGITCWWLTQDRSIPIFDAGLHLWQGIYVYEELAAGHVGYALTLTYPYPPFSYLVGALGIWIAGFGVAPPIVAENILFVPLLALGCYHVGRLAFNAQAGLLAVLFALGSPLIAAQFHVFMTDAPETAMVAVSIWLLLASERFSRAWVSAAAGVAVGLGMMTKEPFPFFVAGVILVMLVRGGWRSWRGLLAFGLPALAIALPWYIQAFSRVEQLAKGAATATGANYEWAAGIAPARFSGANLTWYFWNIVNFQLYAPLFAFALIGAAWMGIGFLRRRPVSPFAWELAVGAVVAWFAITETFVHDIRYSMPLLLYLAVFGSCWIVRLGRYPRYIATGALVLLALANTLGTSFGVGGVVSKTVPGTNVALLERPGVVTFYSNAGFLVAGPQRDGDILGLLHALKAQETHVIAWVVEIGASKELPESRYFTEGGLMALTRIAGLRTGTEVPLENNSETAILGHGTLLPGEPTPCVKLDDGSGVWVQLGDPEQALRGGAGAWVQLASSPRTIQDYCPFRNPQTYSASG